MRKPKQRLGGAGRCLGLVSVIPAANLERDSPSSVDGVTESRTETFFLQMNSADLQCIIWQKER